MSKINNNKWIFSQELIFVVLRILQKSLSDYDFCTKMFYSGELLWISSFLIFQFSDELFTGRSELKNSYNLGEEEILQVSVFLSKARSKLKLHMGNVHPKELKNLLLKENLELAISSINDDSHTTLGIMSTKNSRKLQKKEDPNMLFLLLLLPSCWWWWKNLFMMMTFFDENIQGEKRKMGSRLILEQPRVS